MCKNVQQIEALIYILYFISRIDRNKFIVCVLIESVAVRVHVFVLVFAMCAIHLIKLLFTAYHSHGLTVLSVLISSALVVKVHLHAERLPSMCI